MLVATCLVNLHQQFSASSSFLCLLSLFFLVCIFNLELWQGLLSVGVWRDYVAVLFACSFLLLLSFCIANHTRGIFGVTRKEMCHITQSHFECCVLIWTMSLSEVRTLNFLSVSAHN